MATKLFVNLPVGDLTRSRAFFTALGLDFFGATEDMASVIISEHTQVMLLAEPTFAGYAHRPPSEGTEAILVLGLPDRDAVDALVAKAVDAGATPLGPARDDGGMYQRGFADLDGHQWAALTIGG
ncbi:glyoxalase [Actinorhabdospora filicis]|uniref:Glyoxalase n=1 Tax=Actinorhabdospora filicis TaxID=1785913 RepID=A0A9W6SKU3_9ACTN|nr:VOC family protein [Actinorhabdospora filicis]GLZ77772.1 glyoxalase [Actinorhabdospora filicis]